MGFELYPGRPIDIPFEHRREKNVLRMGQINGAAEGRAIVLIGHVHPVEPRLVRGERAGGVDRGAEIGERADLLLD